MLFGKLAKSIYHENPLSLYDDNIVIQLAKKGEYVQILSQFGDAGFMCKSEYSPILFYVDTKDIEKLSGLYISFSEE